jgi:imidazolonepropionase-like amidohydrolase
MTAAGSTLSAADVVIQRERITAVGAATVSGEDRIVDVSGRWITPGLIDPHSHIGVYALPGVRAHRDGNEVSGPFQPALRAEEGLWPRDPAIRRAVAGGVTTIHVLPGSANLVGGQGVTLRLVPSPSVSEMRFPGAPRTMKMACGENPKHVYGRERKRAPTTRMGEVAMLRRELEEARAYQKKRARPASEDDDKGKGDAKEPLPVDHGKEALAGVLAGEILVQNHCYRADEIEVRLALFEEFGIRPRAFHHAVEAYKVADRLRDAGVAAVVWADWWGFKMEAYDMVPANAALLDVAGARVALHSDSHADVQRMNQEAAKALAAGLRADLPVDADRAIRWITANPAWVLGIDDRVGTIEVGKDADLVVWSGDPLSVYARAEKVFIAGELVYDIDSPDLYPLADFELEAEEESP